VGLTALSVEIMTTASTSKRSAVSTSVLVPKMLFLTASPGFASIIGTCLCAAACRTTSGRYLRKRRSEAVGVGDVRDERDHHGGALQGLELALEIEYSVLVVVEDHDPRGSISHHLAADLRADAARGPRDEDDAALEEGLDRLRVELDRRPAKQVVEVDVAGLDGPVRR